MLILRLCGCGGRVGGTLLLSRGSGSLWSRICLFRALRGRCSSMMCSLLLCMIVYQACVMMFRLGFHLMV